MIDISKLDKAEALAALFNASKPQGLGSFHSGAVSRMTSEEARAYRPDAHEFDYLNGRVMKVDLTGDTLDPYLYDRDNGTGAAERALQPLLAAASARRRLGLAATSQPTRSRTQERKLSNNNHVMNLRILSLLAAAIPLSSSGMSYSRHGRYHPIGAPNGAFGRSGTTKRRKLRNAGPPSSTRGKSEAWRQKREQAFRIQIENSLA